MDALHAANPLELPKTLVDAQVRELQIDAGRRAGAQDASQLPPPETFVDAAKRRVALSLLINEIIKNASLQVNHSLVQMRIEELAMQYPDANQAIQSMRTNPQIRRQIEASVIEDQVVEWLMERAKVTDQPSSFKELMNFGA
jgi:trigger factor